MSDQTTPEITAKPLTGIRRVSFFQVSPVETCDHCSAAIKHVTHIEFRDGTTIKLGSKCGENLLAGDTSLLKVYRKNVKLLAKFDRWLEILSRPEDQIPRGSEYYGSGLYFIGGLDERTGKLVDDISVGRVRNGSVLRGKEFVPARIADNNSHWLFHPLSDFEKNEGGDKYVLGRPGSTRDLRSLGKTAWEPNTVENYQLECRHSIKQAQEWLQIRIAEINRFLCRTLAPKLAGLAPSI